MTHENAWTAYNDTPASSEQSAASGTSSLIKLWHYDGKWHISSNGEIDARKAPINNALLSKQPQSNLYDLFMEAWDKTGVRMENLDNDYTYMFELTSPHNRVVVRYNDISVRHIGTRNNQTLMECDMDIGVPKPIAFPFSTLDECVESTRLLEDDEEGYVVVDQYFNRIKVKSPRYVALNHKVQGVTTRGNIVEIIQKNEQDEFLSYFPEYCEVFYDILCRIEEFSIRQNAALNEMLAMSFDSRKALAEAVQKTDCPACLFALIDKKEANTREWLMSRPVAKIMMYIGLDDKERVLVQPGIVGLISRIGVARRHHIYGTALPQSSVCERWGNLRH